MITTLRNIVLVGSVGLALLGCGKSKVDQCNAFIERAEKAQAAINGVNLESTDKKALEKSIAAVDTEAQAFAALDLKDEKLVGFRTAYGESLASMSKIMKDLAALDTEASDPAKAEAAAAKSKTIVASAEALEKSESALVDQLNQYCSGEK